MTTVEVLPLKPQKMPEMITLVCHRSRVAIDSTSWDRQTLWCQRYITTSKEYL